MGERRGMKALELWCKRVTDGYQGVKVENMTTSWRDGLAFCAIIHHFRPELIDFGSLNKADIFGNNELAFRTAEHHLGIPALLDAEDMVEFPVPDRLSILTYLSQFYQAFAGSRQSTSPSPSRTTPTSKRSASPSVLSPDSQTTPTKMMALGSKRREPCAKCAMPVFIAERLLVGGRKLYHRTCFRCARCQNQLSLANCYETEDGQYCCEACPDEVDNTTSSEDTLSVISEVLMETEPVKTSLPVVFEVKQDKALSDFMIGQLQWEDEEVAPPLPSSAPPLPASSEPVIDNSVQTGGLDNNTSISYVDSAADTVVSNSDIIISLDNRDEDISPYFCTKTNSPESVNASKLGEQVPLENSISDNQPSTANDEREDCINDQNELITNCTKELHAAPTSIVKMRMQMFDGNQQDKNSMVLIYKRKSSDTKAEQVMEHVIAPGGFEDQDPQMNTADNCVPETVKELKDVEDIKIESLVSSEAADTVHVPPEITSLPYDDVQIQEDGECTKSVELMKEENSSIGREEIEIMITSPPVPDLIESSEVQNIPDRDESVGSVELVKKEENSSIVCEEIEIMITSPPVPVLVESSEILNTPDRDESVNDNSVEKMEDTIAIDCNNTDVESIYPKQATSSSVESLVQRKDSVEVYPLDLNPFGEEASQEDDVKESINPFGSDEEDQPRQAPRLSVSSPLKAKPPRPPQPISRKSLTLAATGRNENIAKIAANPFWSDGEEPSSDEDLRPKQVPVPLPRTVKLTTPDPSPMPRLRRNSGNFGSTNSVSSADSSTGCTLRHKKKPAPPPPVTDTTHSSTLAVDISSPSNSTASSPRRHRKARPAPPPPSDELSKPLRKLEVFPPIETEKFEKDKINQNMQTKAGEQSMFTIAVNKSMYGQWKRKKGPAPPRPVPQRREIHAMPMKEVKRELDDIDVKQLGLERQGVCLEKTIRSKFEDAPQAECKQTEDGSLGVTPDLEDMVMQLFEIVNEKNELFRRQAELMYLRRQHRLEEEHADLEYEIRCLMERPEHTKTDTEKAYEEQLIRRLVDVVERRDEIVNCLEMDRQREKEEDRSIHEQMASFAAKSKGIEPDVDKEGILPEKKTLSLKLLKKKGKKNKDKLSKKTSGSNIDSEKDVDESDAVMKLKEKKAKRKWF